MAITLPEANNSEFTGVPVGLYLVRLKAMEEQEPRPSQFHEEPQATMRWVFVIEEVIDSNDEEAEEKVGEELWGFTSITMGKKAKMRAWSEALLGRPMADKEKVTDEMLVGKRAKATVIPHTRQDGTETTKIGSMVPYKSRGNGRPEPF